MVNKSEAKLRLEKLEALKKLGLNPYPSVTPAHLSLAEARSRKEGETIAVVGRIFSLREHGPMTFVDLVDAQAKLQLFVSRQELGEENYKIIKLLDNGDYLWAEGELFTTKAGELTVKVKKFQLLAKALLPIPTSHQEIGDVETRYRHRALDFKVNPPARAVIETRSRVIKTLREFLETRGFLEIQTPILQPIPGGAAAKPFSTHHNALDSDFYLRISDELYLKRLVVGGFERVYEIGPVFRNEGLSTMHNPEFTMCEFYWAYQNQAGLMKVTEELVRALVKAADSQTEIGYQGQKLDFAKPFAVKKYAELIRDEIGLDINELTDFATLKKAVQEKGVKFENQSIKVWSELVDELFKKVARPKIIQPTFVTDYPAVTAPLAKRDEQNPAIAQKFQLILGGGLELINAYAELNDPIEQEARFREQLTMRDEGWEEAQLLDENYLTALKYGLPPTAGWGMGVDRLVMVLTDQPSIKEVIPFPTLRPLNNE